MARLQRRTTLVLVLLGVVAPACGAAEPWADPKLPVKDGLELWLDAARPGPVKRPDGDLDVWSDGSGHGRQVRQAAEAARPRLVRVGEAAVVRFDGLDDHMRAVKQGLELKSFTVFVTLAPRANPGGFRAFLAFNAANRRDYETGLTLDMSWAPTPRLTALNVEGRGFGGAMNLLKSGSEFGLLHTLEVRTRSDAKAVRLYVDGVLSGERPWAAEPLSMDEITVGARYYSNEPGPQRVQGFGRADIAEVLVYNRALGDDQAKAVHEYLATKHAILKQNLPPEGDGRSEVLVPVANPPSVQVFVPGFTVRELPLDLPNVNNIRCRPDGTLVALGYNGDVWLLRDTDGDGLPDKADLFWDNKGRLRSPIGMALTPPKYPHGDGVLVASKGKCSLIVDTDGDGQADKEIVVAEGWKELPHGVDALGAAFDPRDGSLYFGLGCTDYTNAYQVDKTGKALYSLKGERGTILRVSPDFRSREIVATGIRFPVGLAFNRHGDLFATDQEGATWLPNGNPFDELLHIQKGRHYGFPPRHPKHLPNVIDEPSTFDYGPQHQSTCGFCFNEPVKPGGPTFGPDSWAGDAIVTGYSRGKLYRTQLVKTPAGYVARNHLLACLNMLTVDACVTADGGLVVACHSGGPDWGSGPTGKGKLYKITYTDRDHPQPVLVWPAGPREVRVEFDRPVDPAHFRDVLKRTKLTAGEHVRAGDRFESLWPGYAVVQMQKAAPRYDVPVRSAQLTPDRRTLVLATDPLPPGCHYALTLPGMGRPEKAAIGTLPQHAAIDLDFNLSGCEATWKSKDGRQTWSGWLPSLNLDVARQFTVGSALHDALWTAAGSLGELTLTTQLRLTDMLRPAVQPGSRIDYELPAESVTVGFAASGQVLLTSPVADALYPGIRSRTGHIIIPSKSGQAIPLTVRFTGEERALKCAVWWSTAEDQRFRALPLDRAVVPWADTKALAGKPIELARPKELDGGSWARGRKVFFAEPTGCAKCHAVGGQGGAIGPDLSNLVHRDYPSVMRDITLPGFALNPDYLTHVVQLTDGRTLTGVVRTEGGKLHVGDQKAVVTTVSHEDVERLTPSPVSTMPVGLLKDLTPEAVRDLMTFLLTPPPSMPRDHAGPRPRPRTVAEVNAVLAGAPNPPEKTRSLRVVLVAGPKDHGPGEHDYPAWQTAWKELLAADDKVEVATAWEWPAKDEFRKADVMVFFQRGDWNAKRAADVDAFLERGGGLVYIHWAVDGRQDAPGFAKRIGLAWGNGAKFRHGPLDLAFGKEHPVARNLDRLKLVDESYWNLTGTLPAGRVIAAGVEDGKPQPLFWSLEQGKGRVFVSIPGHFSWSFDDPLFRVVLLRGIAWSAKEPVDRFNDLVWPGADVTK